jgi:competence protein ComEA
MNTFTAALSKILDVFSALKERVRSSTFAPLFARAFGVGIALLVLSWIGRSAIFGSATAQTQAAAPDANKTGVTLVQGDAPPASHAEAPASVGAVSPAAAPTSAEIATELQLDAGATLPVEQERGSRGRATPADPVYLNTAGESELRRLPGVGAKRADAILALRRRVGRFQRVEDLLRVKGVGRNAIKKWRPLVRLDVPTAADAGSAPPS